MMHLVTMIKKSQVRIIMKLHLFFIGWAAALNAHNNLSEDSRGKLGCLSTNQLLCFFLELLCKRSYLGYFFAMFHISICVGNVNFVNIYIHCIIHLSGASFEGNTIYSSGWVC